MDSSSILDNSTIINYNKVEIKSLRDFTNGIFEDIETIYYILLQEVRTKDNWEEWIVYMLDGVEQTSLETIELIKDISTMMDKTKEVIKEQLPKIYSKDFIEILFSNPYTKIDFLVDGLRLHRETVSKYLKQLETLGICRKYKN